METPSGRQLGTIERAKYKLRQADMALRCLRQVPTEIAADLRQARPISDTDLRFDTFFSLVSGSQRARSTSSIAMSDVATRALSTPGE
jgi:hypothetical protein